MREKKQFAVSKWSKESSPSAPTVVLLDTLQTPALILADHEVTEDAGSALAFQLLYSGNFEGFVQKNQLNEVRVGLGILLKTSLGNWNQIRVLIRQCP